MKTFLINLPKSINHFTEKLDAKAILCNKPWIVFNDGGHKQVLIFQKDGSLIVSNDGKVVNSKWSYIPANKSILISIQDETYMFHPAFLDNVIFALRQDGKDEYLFMIDENNLLSFLPKTIKEIDDYFAKKSTEQEIQTIDKKENVKDGRNTIYEDIKKEVETKYANEIQLLTKRCEWGMVGVVFAILFIAISVSLCADDNIISGLVFIWISLFILSISISVIIKNNTTTFIGSKIKDIWQERYGEKII